MSDPRRLPGLVPLEVAALIGISLIAWPEQVPVALPLGALATLSLWVRGRSWAEVLHARRGHASIGAIAGLVALAIAVLAGTPLVEDVSGRAIEWSEHPIVRGSGARLFMVMLHAGVTAIAIELALRGWVVERTLEFAPAPAPSGTTRGRVVRPTPPGSLYGGRRFAPPAAILAGALAEAVVTPGDLAARIGALVFGAALGWMYIAAGRSAIAPLCARLTFSLGVVVLEAMMLIG